MGGLGAAGEVGDLLVDLFVEVGPDFGGRHAFEVLELDGSGCSEAVVAGTDRGLDGELDELGVGDALEIFDGRAERSRMLWVEIYRLAAGNEELVIKIS